MSLDDLFDWSRLRSPGSWPSGIPDELMSQYRRDRIVQMKEDIWQMNNEPLYLEAMTSARLFAIRIEFFPEYLLELKAAPFGNSTARMGLFRKEEGVEARIALLEEGKKYSKAVNPNYSREDFFVARGKGELAFGHDSKRYGKHHRSTFGQNSRYEIKPSADSLVLIFNSNYPILPESG